MHNILTHPTHARMLRAITLAAVASAFLLATLVFLSATLPAMLGLKSMVVTSGSMEPAIRMGDVVLISPGSVDSIETGDIITFRSSNGHGMVTHRVLGSRDIRGHTYFQTQGDANSAPDPNLVPVEAVYGRVTMTLPKTGYLLRFATTRQGQLLMITVPLLFIVLMEVRSLLRDMRRRRQNPGAGLPETGAYREQAPAT